MKVLLKGLVPHKVSQVNPMMQDEESVQLRESLKKHGQNEPITTYRGKLVDGRNRVKEALKLGWTHLDAVSLPNNTTLVELKNLVQIKETRRMQSKTQLAMKAAYEFTEPSNKLSQEELAVSNGVGLRMVTHALYILRNDPIAADSFFKNGVYRVSATHLFHSLGKYIEELKLKATLNAQNAPVTSSGAAMDPDVTRALDLARALKLSKNQYIELASAISQL